jgi:hypothetical protein
MYYENQPTVQEIIILRLQVATTAKLCQGIIQLYLNFGTEEHIAVFFPSGKIWLKRCIKTC